MPCACLALAPQEVDRAMRTGGDGKANQGHDTYSTYMRCEAKRSEAKRSNARHRMRRSRRALVAVQYALHHVCVAVKFPFALKMHGVDDVKPSRPRSTAFAAWAVSDASSTTSWCASALVSTCWAAARPSLASHQMTAASNALQTHRQSKGLHMRHIQSQPRLPPLHTMHSNRHRHRHTISAPSALDSESPSPSPSPSCALITRNQHLSTMPIACRPHHLNN
jgi:hypothetical protein